MKQNPKTIKQILNISFLSVSIPALILLLVLTCYTISRQIHADQSDTEIQLSQVTTHMEEVLKRSETQLNNLVVPGSPFHRSIIVTRNWKSTRMPIQSYRSCVRF